MIVDLVFDLCYQFPVCWIKQSDKKKRVITQYNYSSVYLAKALETSCIVST